MHQSESDLRTEAELFWAAAQINLSDYQSYGDNDYLVAAKADLAEARRLASLANVARNTGC